MSKEDILKNANIPSSWWSLCTIENGIIYTPSHQMLYENGSISEEEYQKYLSTKIDICLDDIKSEKVRQSKALLSTWLLKNPLCSKAHNSSGEYYAVTQEKQSLLTQNIMMYSLSKQSNTPYALTWNSTSNVCEEWTIEELTQLSFEIAAYVYPRVKIQQTYEVAINSCNTVDEVNAIEINYDKID